MMDNLDRPKISIIIPVYQSKPYLSQCLDSVLEQSFTDWELLLVDDGSTDGSGELCDKYSHVSDKIRVFHQENSGLSAARNTGLDHASGEYIAMIDSDDVLLDRDYLLLLYYAAVSNHAEVAMCGHRNFSNEDALPEPVGSRKVINILSGEDAFSPGIFPPLFYIDASHGKLFQHELFNEIRYPQGRNMEDYSVMHRLAFPCKKIALVDVIMYGHREHSSSICHATPIKSLAQDYVAGMQDRITYFESLGRSDLVHYSEQQLLHWLRKNKIHEHKK